MMRMKRTATFFARACIVLAIAAAVFAAIGTVAAIQKAAPKEDPVGPVKPVVVVNEPDAPVPVAGTVDITTGQTLPVTGTVEVATSEADPLVVRNVAGAAREPFQRLMFLPNDPLNFNVPAGKRLVIEFVSMAASVDTTCQIISFTLQTTGGGTNAGFFFAPTHVAGPGRNFETFGQQTHLNADPGTQVSISLFTQTINACGTLGSISLSGYLEDVL